MYADYSDYIGEYGGTMIPEEHWQRAARAASSRMDAATFGRLEDGVPAEHAAKVRACCCELAEQFWMLTNSLTAQDDAAGKASESIGAYSVTYRSTAETVGSLLYGESAGLEDLLRSIIGRHLGRTGLLYRGV